MKGVYCLIIKVKIDIIQEIGSLGKIKFKKGDYVYIGSAQNNLEKRIKRHLSKKKKIKWHIDYLLKNIFVKIEKIFYKKAAKKEECEIASFLTKFEEPIKNFGCSDCKCKAHLFKLKSIVNLRRLKLLTYL